MTSTQLNSNAQKSFRQLVMIFYTALLILERKSENAFKNPALSTILCHPILKGKMNSIHKLNTQLHVIKQSFKNINQCISNSIAKTDNYPINQSIK